MKKVTAILVIVMMAMTLMTACGEETVKPDISPYDQLNYDEYLELPDYLSYTADPEEVEITDEDVQTEIDARLQAASTETKEITEGTVDKGDKVKIAFKGTLEDGSSPEGMSSDGYEIELGAASMIDGFQEGIYGATIGEPVTLNLQFPDPYELNEELSGKPVTFEVTVLSKTETVMQELNEEFMKKDSEEKALTEEDYRAYIKDTLQAQAEENAAFDAQTNLYSQIAQNSKVLKTPEEEVTATTERLKEQYKNYVESNGANWEQYLEGLGGQEAYDEGIKQLAESQVQQKIIIYGLCAKEGLKLSDKEYTEELMKYIEAAGGTDIKDFESKSGMTLEGFINMYNLNTEIYLTKVLDKIYDEIHAE